jgi:chromate transporter
MGILQQNAIVLQYDCELDSSRPGQTGLFVLTHVRKGCRVKSSDLTTGMSQAQVGGSSTVPTLLGLFTSFLVLGVTAFGGPAMVAYIRHMAVEKRGWLHADSFDDGVALCQAIPGATAMQTAAYVGLRVRGVAGAAASFVGFGLPAFALMMLLSALYARTHDVPAIIAAFSGLRAIIVALVANAAVSFGKTSLKRWPQLLIAALAATALAFLGLWLAQRRMFDLAVTMFRIDLFAFGGGFSSVPLMFHEVVAVRRWLDGPILLNGIVLGQVTPGPIVITATFIGYLLAGPGSGAVARVGVFLPSFLMLLATAPHFDRLRTIPQFGKVISGVLCSFVGLLLTVTGRFALDVTWNWVHLLLWERL